MTGQASLQLFHTSMPWSLPPVACWAVTSQCGEQQRLPLQRPCAFAGSGDAAADAFYYSKAFVQTLGERLGSALGEALSEAGRHDAELRQAVRCLPLWPQAHSSGGQWRIWTSGLWPGCHVPSSAHRAQGVPGGGSRARCARGVGGAAGADPKPCSNRAGGPGGPAARSLGRRWRRLHLP